MLYEQKMSVTLRITNGCHNVKKAKHTQQLFLIILLYLINFEAHVTKKIFWMNEHQYNS